MSYKLVGRPSKKGQWTTTLYWLVWFLLYIWKYMKSNGRWSSKERQSSCGFCNYVHINMWERVKQLKLFVRIWWRYCLQLWLQQHNPRKYSLILLHKNACTKLINQWTLCSYMKAPCVVQMLWRKAWTPPTWNACESTKCKNCVGRRLWEWIPNLNWKCFNIY